MSLNGRDWSRKGFYHRCQAFGCVCELYAKPAWIVPGDFAEHPDSFVLAWECKAQNDFFINSKSVWGLNKRSAKAYVPGSRFERRLHGKAVHAQTAEFSGMFSSLLGETHGKVLSSCFPLYRHKRRMCELKEAGSAHDGKGTTWLSNETRHTKESPGPIRPNLLSRCVDRRPGRGLCGLNITFTFFVNGMPYHTTEREARMLCGPIAGLFRKCYPGCKKLKGKVY